MAWKYPKRPIKGTYVTDIDAINENFLTFAEENAGFLNEHNFMGPGVNAIGMPRTVTEIDQLLLTRTGKDLSFGGILGSNQLPEDAGYRLHYTQPSMARNPSNKAGDNWTKFSGSDFYTTKDLEGFRLTREFSGGVVWICCSFTLHNHPTPAYTELRNRNGTDGADFKLPIEKGFGFNLALQVDGAIIPESLVGTGDITQEYFGEKEPSVSAWSVEVESRGGGGLNGARNAVTLDAVVNLAPGSHTIRVAVQDIRNSNATVENTSVHISTIELFALEIMG